VTAHWFRAKQQRRRIHAAADAAITLNMIAELSSSAVLLCLCPITLTVCNDIPLYLQVSSATCTCYKNWPKQYIALPSSN
jgi:hypothetical protein